MADLEENAVGKDEDVEEGWVKVGKKKTQRLTEEDQEEMKTKAAKKRKKGQLVSYNFYFKVYVFYNCSRFFEKVATLPITVFV